VPHALVNIINILKSTNNQNRSNMKSPTNLETKIEKLAIKLYIARDWLSANEALRLAKEFYYEFGKIQSNGMERLTS
jgi:hypothetical protein